MKKVVFPSIIIVVISVLLISAASKLPFLEGAEDSTYDFRLRYFAPLTKVSDKIVMIWIDDETIRTLPYRSPVPRDFLTRLNNKLAGADPQLIAFDIFFQDPTIKEYDDALAKSLSQVKSYSVSGGTETPDGKQIEEKPLPIFQEALSGYGLSDQPISAYDSVVRRFKPFMLTDDGAKATFAGVLYQAIEGKDAGELLNEKSRTLLGMRFKPFKTSRSGEMTSYIRYAGPPGRAGSEENTFKIFPAYLVANGLVPLNWLRGKVVLIGSAYNYSQDAFLTPFFSKKYDYARMNGVEIHANILNSLLENEFFYMPDTVQSLLLLLVIGGIVAFLTLRLRLVWSTATLFITIVTHFILALYLFKARALVLPVIAPIGTGIVSFGLSIGWRSVTEGRQKRFIKDVFSKYVHPSVVDEMLKDPSKLVLGGEKREITSMFTDIESFTTISEHLDPETLVSFLNEYLSRIADAIFRCGGTIDKYEGDAVIAFFGAPIGDPDHAEAAVNAAIEIEKITGEVGKTWHDRCEREIVTRIGINSGPAVVGNMGSEGRFDYTAIGDTVNLASRLEETNKKYGTRILISQFTKERISDRVKCCFIDNVMVKGKTKGVDIFEVVSN